MCHETPDAGWVFEADPAVPAQVRRLLASSRCTLHHTAIARVAEIVTSELVTNAVRHGRPPLTMSLHCDESLGLEISVGDGSLQPPLLERPGPEAQGDRGIQLVDRLSHQWGVTSSVVGKVVWARIR